MMGKRIMPVLVVAAFLVPAGTSPAQQAQGTFVLGVVSTGQVQGTVALTQQPRASRARSVVSLHGLTPETEYTVSVFDSRCPGSTRATASGAVAVDIMGGPRSTGLNDDLFSARRVRLDAPLRRARSVRVFELSDTGPPALVACMPLRPA